MTRLAVPMGNVWLEDNRCLRMGETESNPAGPGVIQTMTTFRGPKGLTVLASLDPSRKWGPLLHVSLSYPGHLPSWKDVRLVRAAFFPPTVDAMMVLPQEGYYLNIHQFCFHLWQCPEEWRML